MSDKDKKDYVIFGTKTLSDLFKDIYTKVESKDVQIDTLIDTLSAYVTNANTATLIVPLIAQYIEVGVRNKEQLVKLADIVQRLIRQEFNNTNNGDIGLLTDEEKKQLHEEAVRYTELLRKNATEKAVSMSVAKLNKKTENKLRKIK